MASDFRLSPHDNNSQEGFEHCTTELHAGETVEPAARAFLSIDHTNHETCDVEFACVHLSPHEALSLACWLMDWAREHMEGMRLIGDFGVQEEDDLFADLDLSEFSGDPEPDPFEDEDAQNAIEPEEMLEMYCQVCGSTLVNGECPEEKALSFALNQSGIPVAVQQEDIVCSCDVCREWRMRN